jgi:uncharacterized protein YciI
MLHNIDFIGVEEQSMPLWDDYKQHSKDRGMLALELFVVVTTPAGTPEQVKAELSAHLAYQRQMEMEGRLVLAGPTSDETGQQMEGAGMILYRAASMEEARRMAEADPMHSSGARTFTLRKWLVNEGSLTLSVGLSTGTVRLG